MAALVNVTDTQFPTTQVEEAAFLTFYGFYYAFYGPEWILRLVVLILSLVFCRLQPVRSRFLLPLIVSVERLFYIAIIDVILGFQLADRATITAPQLWLTAKIVVLRSLNTLRYPFGVLSTSAFCMLCVRFAVQRMLCRLQREHQALKRGEAAGSRPVGDTAAVSSTSAATTSKTKSLEIRIKICRILMSKWVYFLVVFPVPILLLLPLTTALLALSFTVAPTLDAETISYVIYAVYLIFFAAIPATVFFWIDLFVHRARVFGLGKADDVQVKAYKQGRGGLKWFLFKSDPFLYRLEFISIMIAVVFGGFIGGGCNLLFRFLPKLPFAARHTIKVIIYVCNFIYYFTDTARGGGIVVTAVLYQKFVAWRARIRRRKYRKSMDHSNTDLSSIQSATNGLHGIGSLSRAEGTGNVGQLIRVLKTELGAKLFEAFCRREFSVENFVALKAVLQFKMCTDDVQRWELAKQIADEHIKVGAVMEINIDSRERQQVLQTIRNAEPATPATVEVMTPSSASSEGQELVAAEAAPTATVLPTAPSVPTLDKSIFSSVERTLLNNLSDTFSRFSTTESYLDVLLPMLQQEGKKSKLLKRKASQAQV